MRFLRLLLTFLALAGTTASNVRAQTVDSVVVQVAAPQWRNRPPTDQLTNTVNRQDCLAADVAIDFQVTLTGSLSSKVLEVWSGSDCATKNNRDEHNCVKVYTKSASTGVVSILVKDMLQPGGDAAQGPMTGTEETCDMAGGSSEATKRTLYFLVIDPGEPATPAGQGEWVFSFDVTPPGPPVDVKVGPGEESLVITYSPPGDLDLAKYRAYCAEDEGGCTSSELVPDGDVPEGMGECGSTNSTLVTELTANGLANGTSYAVALVSEDKLGNRSKLSTIGCGVPQEVTGYFEAYRAAGGEGGGGFCSFAPPRRGAVALFALALVGAALLRRRR